MTWNYRIFRHKAEGYYSLHEVFYNDEGVPITYAIDPDAIGETIDELVSSLKLMLKDADAHTAKKKKVLSTKDFEKGGVYFVAMKAWENEISEDIDTLSLPTLPPSTNGKGNSKNPRRKSSPRNKQPRK